MMQKGYENRYQIAMVSIEELAPQEHLLMSEAAEAGYLKPAAVFIDGTHIKANANAKKKIERVFADAKEKHAMRYTLYTGLAQVTNR